MLRKSRRGDLWSPVYRHFCKPDGRPKVAPTTLLRLKLYVWHSRFCVGDGVLDVPLYAPSKLPANGMSGGHPLRITRSSFVERNKSFRLNVPVGATFAVARKAEANSHCFTGDRKGRPYGFE